MPYSPKCYASTKGIMKKYVNVTEGSLIYSFGKTRFATLIKEVGAIYKVDVSTLVNTEIFEDYLEQFHENPVPLPQNVWK